MKKVLISTLLSLAATSLFAANTNSFQITPTLGKNFSDEASKMTNSEVLYGIRGSWKSVSGYGGELGFEQGSDVKYQGEETSTTLSRVFANIIMIGESAYDITPYVLVGAGYEFLETNIQGDPDQGFIDGGVGFNYQLTSYINLVLEVKGLYKLDTEDLDYVGAFGCSLLFDDNFHINRIGSPFEEKKVMEKALDEHHYDTN